MQLGAGHVPEWGSSLPLPQRYLGTQPTDMMGRGEGRSGGERERGARVACKQGEGDEHPLPTPHIPPQSIDPSPLTRPHMREVEMISEAEKS